MSSKNKLDGQKGCCMRARKDVVWWPERVHSGQEGCCLVATRKDIVARKVTDLWPGRILPRGQKEHCLVARKGV